MIPVDDNLQPIRLPESTQEAFSPHACQVQSQRVFADPPSLVQFDRSRLGG